VVRPRDDLALIVSTRHADVAVDVVQRIARISECTRVITKRIQSWKGTIEVQGSMNSGASQDRLGIVP